MRILIKIVICITYKIMWFKINVNKFKTNVIGYVWLLEKKIK